MLPSCDFRFVTFYSNSVLGSNKGMCRGCKRLAEINPSMDALVKEPTTPILLMTILWKRLHICNKTQWTGKLKSLSSVLIRYCQGGSFFSSGNVVSNRYRHLQMHLRQLISNLLKMPGSFYPMPGNQCWIAYLKHLAIYFPPSYRNKAFYHKFVQVSAK